MLNLELKISVTSFDRYQSYSMSSSQPTKKILLIEDNESYLSILSQKFTYEKFEVITAKDGDEGIKMALDNKPDIVLIDLLLPKKNGVQIMEALRQNEWGKNVPLIILTNVNPDDEILATITKNKPAYYLVKPEVKLDDILEKVRSLLNNATN